MSSTTRHSIQLSDGDAQYRLAAWQEVMSPSDTPKIVLGLQVRGVKAGDKLTATWIAEKTDLAPPNFEITSSAIPLGASEFVSASLSKPNAGWPAGRYRVELKLNDDPVEFRQYFQIEGSK
jgi:hypothetical protein